MACRGAVGKQRGGENRPEDPELLDPGDQQTESPAGELHILPAESQHHAGHGGVTDLGKPGEVDRGFPLQKPKGREAMGCACINERRMMFFTPILRPEDPSCVGSCDGGDAGLQTERLAELGCEGGGKNLQPLVKGELRCTVFRNLAAFPAITGTEYLPSDE